MSVCLIFIKAHHSTKDLSLWVPFVSLRKCVDCWQGMSEGPKYHQRSTDYLEVENPVVALSCGRSFCHRRCLHALLSRGTALVISVVRPPITRASFPSCTSPEASCSWRVPNTFLQFLLLSSTLPVGRAQLVLVLILSVSPLPARSLGSPSHCVQRPSSPFCPLSEVLPIGHLQRLTSRVDCYFQGFLPKSRQVNKPLTLVTFFVCFFPSILTEYI